MLEIDDFVNRIGDKLNMYYVLIPEFDIYVVLLISEFIFLVCKFYLLIWYSHVACCK